MDQTEHQKLQALSEFTKSQFLKKVAQLLLSVSVFSFFFSYSTWLSFLSRSFNLSSFPFQLLTHTINRNCIFLLCNGILVFLARNSGLIRSSSSGFDHAEEYLIKKTGDRLPLLLDKEATTVTTEPPESAADDQEERDKKYFFKEEETENLIEEDEEQELDHGTSLLEGKNPKKSSLESSLFIEEEEEEEEHSSLSTEELNKKFDDFIRRMKEEIRIGSMTTNHSLAIKESSSFDQSV